MSWGPARGVRSSHSYNNAPMIEIDWRIPSERKTFQPRSTALVPRPEVFAYAWLRRTYPDHDIYSHGFRLTDPLLLAPCPRRMTWSVEATIGPLLIFVYIAFTWVPSSLDNACLNCADRESILYYSLFGIYIAQFYYYYTTYRNDKRYLRLYVWAMGWVNLIMIIASILHTPWPE